MKRAYVYLTATFLAGSLLFGISAVLAEERPRIWKTPVMPGELITYENKNVRFSKPPTWAVYREPNEVNFKIKSVQFGQDGSVDGVSKLSDHNYIVQPTPKGNQIVVPTYRFRKWGL